MLRNILFYSGCDDTGHDFGQKHLKWNKTGILANEGRKFDCDPNSSDFGPAASSARELWSECFGTYFSTRAVTILAMILARSTGNGTKQGYLQTKGGNSIATPIPLILVLRQVQRVSCGPNASEHTF